VVFAHILLTDYSLSNSVSQHPLFIKNETKIEKSGQVYLVSQRGHQTGMWYPREQSIILFYLVGAVNQNRHNATYENASEGILYSGMGFHLLKSARKNL
jgi:hypothetical protein